VRYAGEGPGGYRFRPVAVGEDLFRDGSAEAARVFGDRWARRLWAGGFCSRVEDRGSGWFLAQVLDGARPGRLGVGVWILVTRVDK